MERIVTNCPFPEAVRKEAQAAKDVETFYVSLLLEPPSSECIETLRAFTSEIDSFEMAGGEVYLLLREGIRNSKLANHLSKLGVPSTMRNWKTMNRLSALAKNMP